uniref:Uncharacterized protein n=1 Tax=Rhizophora mucronata TaxID=61149 RepID=A0A2P2LGJ9_RHIMU
MVLHIFYHFGYPSTVLKLSNIWCTELRESIPQTRRLELFSPDLNFYPIDCHDNMSFSRRTRMVQMKMEKARPSQPWNLAVHSDFPVHSVFHNIQGSSFSVSSFGKGLLISWDVAVILILHDSTEIYFNTKLVKF